MEHFGLIRWIRGRGRPALAEHYFLVSEYSHLVRGTILVRVSLLRRTALLLSIAIALGTITTTTGLLIAKRIRRRNALRELSFAIETHASLLSISDSSLGFLFEEAGFCDKDINLYERAFVPPSDPYVQYLWHHGLNQAQLSMDNPISSRWDGYSDSIVEYIHDTYTLKHIHDRNADAIRLHIGLTYSPMAMARVAESGDVRLVLRCIRSEYIREPEGGDPNWVGHILERFPR